MSESELGNSNHHQDGVSAGASGEEIMMLTPLPAPTAEQRPSTTRSGRARRTTVKKVDYAREQEFSDEDVFEDDDPQTAAVRRSTSNRKHLQQQTTPAAAGTSDDGGNGSEKQLSTSAAAIRQRKSRARRKAAATAAAAAASGRTIRPAASAVPNKSSSARIYNEDDGDDDVDDDDDDDLRLLNHGGSNSLYANSGHDSNTLVIRRPVYTEKGYDASLLPIRDRFPFLPEYEEDGSPKIELIVGRRPVDEKEDALDGKPRDDDGNVDDDDDHQHGSDDEPADEETTGHRRKRGRSGSLPATPTSSRKKKDKLSPKDISPSKAELSGPVEYEYLVKYKGRSYLHLEWKSGADLESMNKSAKGIYRRFLKKVVSGTDEELENPEFDPSFVVPEKIIDEKEQEMTIELSDAELLAWETQREKEMAERLGPNGEVEGEEEEEDTGSAGPAVHDHLQVSSQQEPRQEALVTAEPIQVTAAEEEEEIDIEWTEDEVENNVYSLEKLRSILKKDSPYYTSVEGSTNPYRDGYVKEPPKKPRAAYLFFQCTVRSYYQKRYTRATQAELMSMLGDKWHTLSDPQREPFAVLAKEEGERFEKERALLEKAQRPTEVWQPMRRCLLVLERLAKDSFAEVFLEPVDIRDFPDYQDYVDTPMDIGTVKSKLLNKKYQAPEQFARDMRKIWNNCKIYNQHGSAIWHVADYMSKQFERLYHAWVLEFRERYLRWSEPRARPWEHTCRQHDGSCNISDHLMVLCDHCDAMYGIQCVSPPLKKVPTKAWHCPDCRPKLKSVKGVRMLSAVAEHAARKRAELGDLPKKKIKQTMFLVKWAGLGYEFCTWETREDINEDQLIAQYRRLNKAGSNEPDLPQDMLAKFLDDTKHINDENAGGVACIPNLRSQLYAQSHAFHFVKFGIDLPHQVCSECGPKSKSALGGFRRKKAHPREVVECLNDLLFRVARGDQTNSIRSSTSLPPPMTGEYDAVIPITSKGLMMNVGEINESVAFLGYRQFPNGSKGPAELANLIRNVGDKIIAVDGASTIGKSFKEVIMLLRESGKNKFAYMRFLESKYTVCENDLVSVGVKGRYAIEELQKKFVTDRQRVIVERKCEVKEEPDPASLEALPTSEPNPTEAESDAGSEGEFQPESDDDIDLEDRDDMDPSEKITQSSAPLPSEPVPEISVSAIDEEKKEAPDIEPSSATPTLEEAISSGGIDPSIVKEEVSPEAFSSPGILCRQETTRSLSLRLLDFDVGYSSDEGGDDDCAYYLDGVDKTFSSREELELVKPKRNKPDDELYQDTVPAKQNDFVAQGERAKLAAAVALTARQPTVEEFDNFPYPSSKDIALAEENAPASSKSSKRSTVKVEQVSLATGEILHVWANVESAAATLQLPLNELKQVLRGEYDEDIGDEVGGFRWRYAAVGAKVTAGASGRGGGGKKAEAAWLEFRDKLYDPSDPHIYKNSNRLRDYQVDGVNWLASTWYKRQGCILADEMGLGKTVQIVCYIEHLFRVEKIQRPYLVVVPLSTVEHWRREFEGWTDMVCCIYHDRQRVWRDVLREYEWYYEDKPHTAEYLKFDVLVTTYDTLIGDFDVVSQIPFRVAVVDEAHRLRNQKGKLLECMREISAKGTMQYGFQSRVLMSGTPLQNDLTELWTLLNFIEPFKFPDLGHFEANFGNMANRSQVEALQRMISPCMLRRVKEDVAKDIPAKEETVIDVELTSVQKQYYRAIFEHNHAFLSMGATRQVAPKLMNIQMELRKVCNHPFLLEGIEHRETERQYKEFIENGAFEGKTPEEQQHMLNGHGYIMTSGKMVLLDKLLPKLRHEGHKILIFSQMVKMLDLISEYCEFRDFKYERLDGRVRGTDRQKSIDRFEREKDSFLFLLSTRAGGVGINLTAADICIIFDSDWNPQNDVQAQARCHRIGQTKDVRIYRLVTSRSFEQEMFDRASKKLGLEQAVLGTFEKEKDDDRPTEQEMEQLLKKGAYALLEDENDEITKEFCTDDIESILKKRTRTRVVEGAKTASWLNKQGMVVSKSKFTSETGKDSLDMDDPLFWQKVMPDFVTPSIMLQKLNDLQDEIEGRTGRGRGRWKRKRGRPRVSPLAEEANDANADATPASPENSQLEENDVAADPDDMSDDENDEPKAKGKIKISRAMLRKVHKFFSDLKSMMEGIFEDPDEEGLTSVEKDICQKLLLTISVKEKIFNDEQRQLAKKFLKQIEGDRRRRCRTSEQSRFRPGLQEDEPGNAIPEGLMILKKKRKKRRKREEIEAEEQIRKRRKKNLAENGSGYVGEDGYLHHSDSEADWSDIGEDLYVGKKKDRISRKEARRRRQWASDDDAATAAGRPWPVFPRHVVKKVLNTILDEVMKYDEVHGGAFSAPVPRDEFPDYYERIKKPMDYSTMRLKLDNGEYRSAQAMQKDFILILQNCRNYNDPTSDIVKEARAQHLMRPEILKEAAMKHDLFLSEDGTVLEIFDDDKPGSGKKRRKKAEGDNDDVDDSKPTKGESDSPIPRKTRKKKLFADPGKENGIEATAAEEDGAKSRKDKKKKKSVEKACTPAEEATGMEESTAKETVSKPRIRIRMKGENVAESSDIQAKKGKKGGTKRLRIAVDGDENAEAVEPEESARLRKKRKVVVQKKKVRGNINSSKDEVEAENGEGTSGDEGKMSSEKGLLWDASYLKRERTKLNGTFDSARSLFTRFGPWKLPVGLEDRFADVANATLSKMDKHDRYSVFAEAVTDEEAPDYSKIVKRPMDFGTMRQKVSKGKYGKGSDAATAFYKDFLLTFDNCRLYNKDDSEVTEEAARVFALLPEAFAHACGSVSKK